MGTLLGLVFLAVAILAVKNVDQKSAKKQRILIASALATEIIASVVGYAAGNSLTNDNCSGTPAISYVAWLLALAGAFLAARNVYIAAKGKQLVPIVLALLLIILCLAAAAFAWFVSVFCITF